ncbi:MAG: hypothetical protein U5N86_11380 [Planctomycetota bacterium]|nr:hypothetical protein [Planctomycetota bacterium]
MKLTNTVGWALIAVSVLAIATTSPRHHSGLFIHVPALLPFFGIPFCILFLGVQGFIAYIGDTRRALGAIGGGALFGLLVAGSYFIFSSTESLEKVGISPARYVLLQTSSFSGISLGYGTVRGWVTR